MHVTWAAAQNKSPRLYKSTLSERGANAFEAFSLGTLPGSGPSRLGLGERRDVPVTGLPVGRRRPVLRVGFLHLASLSASRCRSGCFSTCRRPHQGGGFGVHDSESEPPLATGPAAAAAASGPCPAVPWAGAQPQL